MMFAYRRLIALLICGVLLVSTAEANNKICLRVGIPDILPERGRYVEFVQNVGEALGYCMAITVANAKRTTRMFNRGELDIDALRSREAFSQMNQAILIEPPLTVAKSVLLALGPEGRIPPRVIAFMHGSSIAKSLLADLDVAKMPVANFEAMIQLLATGRVDAVFIDRQNIARAEKLLGKRSTDIIASFPDVPLYVVVHERIRNKIPEVKSALSFIRFVLSLDGYS